MNKSPLPEDRVTHRPLPAHDPTLLRLGDEERAIAGERWIGRSHNELETGRAFDFIARSLAAMDADADMVALAVRAADDEIRHSEICRRVASAYLGREVAPASLEPLTALEPRGAGAGAKLPAELELTLFIIEMSCLSEGIGTAVLEANLAATRTPLARAATRELLTDELNHARLGWAYLASPAFDDARRLELGPWLRPSLERVLTVWTDEGEYPTSPALTEHGCPSTPVVRAAILSGVRDLALPGFDHVGVPTAAARAWFATVDR